MPIYSNSGVVEDGGEIGCPETIAFDAIIETANDVSSMIDDDTS